MLTHSALRSDARRLRTRDAEQPELRQDTTGFPSFGPGRASQC